MRTYVSRNNVWICEINFGGVLCICEANRRTEARRGALQLARARAQKLSRHAS